MRASILAHASLLLPLAAAFTVLPAAKPCAPASGVSAETLLAQAQIARRIAGTETVELDASRACINIGVRTPGTARLVELLLRGVKVPPEAVRFQIDSSAVPGPASRRT
jgi:hypothetical protein